MTHIDTEFRTLFHLSRFNLAKHSKQILEIRRLHQLGQQDYTWTCMHGQGPVMCDAITKTLLQEAISVI